MLAELKRIHEDLLSCISELEDVVADAAPSRTRLADVRWRLSRASGRRTKFIEETVYPHLLDRVSPPDAQNVTQLREQNAALRAASTKHVGKWTIEHAIDDWPSYRLASTAMTASMRKRIATEKHLLYPLLDGA